MRSGDLTITSAYRYLSHSKQTRPARSSQSETRELLFPAGPKEPAIDAGRTKAGERGRGCHPCPDLGVPHPDLLAGPARARNCGLVCLFLLSTLHCYALQAESLNLNLGQLRNLRVRGPAELESIRDERAAGAVTLLVHVDAASDAHTHESER